MEMQSSSFLFVRVIIPLSLSFCYIFYKVVTISFAFEFKILCQGLWHTVSAFSFDFLGTGPRPIFSMFTQFLNWLLVFSFATFISNQLRLTFSFIYPSKLF